MTNNRRSGGGFDPVRTSKFLSLVLRHRPETIGLSLGEGGWVAIDDLLTAMSKHQRALSRDQLADVVENNSKKRFALDDAGTHIRAVQGHSKAVDLGYEAEVPPDNLYHGTVERFLTSILEEGLSPGSRLHVHLSLDVKTAEAVGRRRGKPVVLTVDSGGMHVKGHRFYRADNGVWLTESVPPAFLRFNPPDESGA